MNTPTDRSKKLLALQAAMLGNTAPLREFKTHRGRPYSDQELEERRLYLGSLSGKDATMKETIAFFGRYEPTEGVIQCYELPNGMRLYFNHH
jgi:hypothetical protein